MATGARTHYDTLGIDGNATPEIIRAAHAKMSQKFRALGDKTRLRAADAAFIVLKDPALRAQYDREIAVNAPAPAAPPASKYFGGDGPGGSPARALGGSASGGAASGVSGAGLPPPALPRRRPPEGADSEPAPPLSARRQAEAYLRRPRVELAREAHLAEDWAGFWRRLLASWVDSIVLYVPYAIVMGVAVVLMLVLKMNERTGPIFLVAAAMGTLILYHALFIASSKVATPGRMALGIAVVDAETGEPPSTGQAVMRSVLSMLGYFLIIPNLIGLFNRRKQSLADIATNTVVVNYKPNANALVIVIVVGIGLIAAIGILAAVAIPAYQDYVMRARVAEVRQDLAGYAQALEQQVRATGGVPRSLDQLPYSPRSKIGTYSVKRNGSIIAEFKVGREDAVLLLQPSVSKETGAIAWECRSDGLRPPLMPRDCPQMEQ